MASIFDYYGSMRKGMEDREKEKEATILARQDAMYKHLERFPTLDDDSINAYGKQFGINDSFLKSVKKQRDQNVFEQEEQNKQLKQKTISGDLGINEQEIANNTAALNYKKAEETFDNDIALSNLDVELKNVNLKQSLNNLKESEFDFAEKRKSAALVFRKLQLDVEGKSISNDQAKETLLQNKQLFPYELQKTIQDLEKGEISIQQALQTLTQDALLFDHTLDSKRLTNIKTKEDILNQYKQFNYNATPEEVEDFLRELDVNPARALEILAYHKTVKDKEDQEIFIKSLEVKKQQSNLVGDLYKEALKETGFNHQLAVDIVMNQMGADGNEDLIKMTEIELSKFNQTQADKAKNAEAMNVIRDISPTASMSVVKQTLESNNVSPELAKAVLAEHKARLTDAFIKDVNSNRGLLQNFLQADETETRRLLSEVYKFDAEDMTVEELDVLKNIVYSNKTYGDMKNKSIIEAAADAIKNNQSNMANFLVSQQDDLSKRNYPVLQLINTQYHISPEDIAQINQELQLIGEGNMNIAFSKWQQQYGNNYQTNTQFRTGMVNDLTDTNKPFYLDEDNKPIDSTSDDAQITEKGLLVMRNYLDDQVGVIINGTDSGIDKTNKLLKLQEKLKQDLEKMQITIQGNETDPDSDNEFQLVLQFINHLDKIINNQIEELRPEVEVEKEKKQNTFNNTDTYKLINEEIDSIITETIDGRGFLAGNDEKRFKKILRRKLNEYNTKNGTNVSLDALINSLKQSGKYPKFDGGMIR